MIGSPQQKWRSTAKWIALHPRRSPVSALQHIPVSKVAGASAKQMQGKQEPNQGASGFTVA
jgi:hypothetical protein